MKNKKIIIGIITLIIVILLIIGILLISKKKSDNKDYQIEQITSWNYFNLHKDGKIGVIDRNGNIIINPEYTSIQIPNPTKSVFICTKDNKSIVLNENSQEIFTKYQEVTDIKLNELAIEIPYEKSILRYKKNDKYGLINFEGEEITNAIYEDLQNLPYKEGQVLVKKDGKLGVINMLGKTVIENKYDEIKIDSYYEEENNYKNSGYIVGKNVNSEMQYDYINYKKEQLNKESYKSIQRITDIQNKDEVYLIYEKNGKYGVIKNNTQILKNEYDSIKYDNLNKLFIILKDNKYAVANIEGQIIISNQYDLVEIEGTYIYAQKDNKQLVFDNKGQQKENIQYKSEYLVDNSQYKIVINQENKYGVEDLSGRKIIDNIYFYIEYLNNNYFIVSGQDGKNGIIDSNGKKVLELKYDTIQKLDNSDLIQAYSSQTDMAYLYNSDVKKVAELKFGKIYDGKDYVKIYSNQEVKYFDLKGKEKTNKEILENNLLFADVKNGKWGFVDKSGNIKIDYNYDEVTEFNQYGFAGIKKDGKWGSVDQKANIVIEPIYTLSIDNSEISFIGKYYKFIYGYKKFYYTDNKK